jgi:hypothetical protein
MKLKPKKAGKKNPKQDASVPAFYVDGGLTVFTREHHLERGYCCESGCRHCPYGYKK